MWTPLKSGHLFYTGHFVRSPTQYKHVLFHPRNQDTSLSIGPNGVRIFEVPLYMEVPKFNVATSLIRPLFHRVVRLEGTGSISEGGMGKEGVGGGDLEDVAYPLTLCCEVSDDKVVGNVFLIDL